nr:hypothetical protein [Tanacetum cinerariifolium]
MGFDDAYLPIRSNILTREPLPSMKTAFAVVSREESHRSIASIRTSPKPSATAFEWGGRGVKEKNKDVTAKDGVSSSMTDETLVKEKQSYLVDTSIPTAEMDKLSSLDDTTALGSFPSLSTLVTTTAGNAPSKSSYANVTGILSGKKLNIRTLFTPRGNEIHVVVPVESSYARVMIELRADVELKDNIVVAMPRIKEGYYTYNIRVEYKWKPPMCACCKVFGHIHEECPKNIGAGATKNLKKTSQTPKGILVGQKMGFKPKQVLTSVNNDVDLGTNEGILISADKGTNNVVDDDGNPLVPTSIVESDSEVEVVFDETANLRISMSDKDGSDKDEIEFFEINNEEIDPSDHIDYDDVVETMGTIRETLTEGEEGALHLGSERDQVFTDLSPEEKDRVKETFLKFFDLNTSSLQERRTGFTAVLAVLITGASQSRQHGKSQS